MNSFGLSRHLARNMVFLSGVILLLLLALMMLRNPGGIGGTGIGGGDEGGIGGTGIWGTIDRFGSIHVNGLIIDYSPDQKVNFADREATADDLRLGQVVLVSAERRDDRLLARKISVRHEVVGPVEAIDERAGTITVLGQTVNLAALGIPMPEMGAVMAVSGYFDSRGVIEATRLDKALPDARFYVRSRIGRGVDHITIGSLELDIKATEQDIRAMLYVTAQAGNWVVEEMRVLPEFPFAATTRELSLQGYRRSVKGEKLVLGDMRLEVRAAGTASKILLLANRDETGRVHIEKLTPQAVMNRTVKPVAVEKTVRPEKIQQRPKPRAATPAPAPGPVRVERPAEPRTTSETTTVPLVRPTVDVAPIEVPVDEKREVISAPVEIRRPVVTEPEPVRRPETRPENTDRPAAQRPVRPQRPERPKRPERPRRPGRG
ncbi:hypothetical protein MNBD_ALPHA01-1191 [hydrothermal vent metagenome]|uniref:DUF5666 domain-containing protein n=1 Tax=hydrothermal vent metagenome TaxID=652676 RepID=A0A3B0RVN0_9ZZZZ